MICLLSFSTIALGVFLGLPHSPAQFHRIEDSLGRGIDQLLNEGCDAISFVALAFKQMDCRFDGLVGE